MNYLQKNYKVLIVVIAVSWQFVFPQFSHAYVIANSGVDGSVLAISNSPQAIMFDAYSNSVPTRLPLSTPRDVRKTVRVTITAYSSTPDQTDSTPFITANGEHVRDGIVAANFLPFGTKLKIPELYGEKLFSVEDRMNARYYYKIDIWMASREEAKQFGVKYVDVDIF